MPFPPPSKHSLKIFDNRPAADINTFQAGVPGTTTEEDSISIILFSPNLQIIASMDNTNSEVTSNYETAVSFGFSISSTQSVSISEELGVSIEVVSAKVSTTFALSFTEEWSQTTTKTMSFSCPPGKKAFVYQGTLMSQLLKFDAGNNDYSWMGNSSKALTQVLLTSGEPIGMAPSNPVTIVSN
jgi:hypothetical protein